MGRPETYTLEWAQDAANKIPDLMRNGESIAEVCVALDMSKDTFYRCVKKYDCFSDAYKKGVSLSESWWARLGRDGACGMADINPTVWIFNMKNRFEWVDKKEIRQEINAEVSARKTLDDFYDS